MFVVVLLVVLALASTTGLIRLGASDQGTQPTDQTARRAYDLLAEGFGPGFNGPIPIVVDVNGDAQAPQRVYDGVRNLEGVASAGEPQFNDEETVAIVFVTPDSAPQDVETEELVDRLRGEVVPAATEGSDAAVYVSGLNAAFIDIADRIMERLPLFLLYIIGVTFIVLAMAFRSIVISLTASIATLLSAFVGFGVLTLVIQEGHGMGLTGLDRTGPIETFVPPIAFAILFGLSMDYMVFLMSRIREEHVHGLKTREAIEHGIAAIGRVIVAAALIMGTVFAAFILTSDRISKEFGLLLAVAILVDALVVKMTLIPAFFTVAGREDLVHAALARPRASRHHHRASARRRAGACGCPAEAGAGDGGMNGGRARRIWRRRAHSRLSARRGCSHPCTAAPTARGSVFRPWSPATRMTVRPGASGGMPKGSRSPWTTSTGTVTASSSGSREGGGFSFRRGCSGKARQITPIAPVASTVRHATRPPSDRPPATRRRSASGPARSCSTTAVHAASSCRAGAGLRRPATR